MDGTRQWMTWAVGGVALALAAGAALGAKAHVEDEKAEPRTGRVVADEPAVAIGAVDSDAALAPTQPKPDERPRSARPADERPEGREAEPPPEPLREDEREGADAASGDVASRAEESPAGPPEPAATGSILDSESAGPGFEALPLGDPDTGSTGETGFGGMALDDLGLGRTIGAVAAVVLLIIALRFVLGRAARLGGGGIRGQLGAGGRAPSGVVQILGRYPVARGQTLVLMKLDRRVLLLSQTSAGFTTLSEVTEADDVASILSKARDEEGESLSARFGALLRRLERDPGIADTDDIEIAPYLRRPSLDEIERVEGDGEFGSGGSLPGGDDALRTEDAGAALRRRLEGLRGLSA